MYLLNVYLNSNGTISFEDVSNAGSNSIKTVIPGGDAKNNEWFNLRVEMYQGDKSTVSFKIYVNDKLMATTNNYTGKEAGSEPKGLAPTVSFYSMSATRGTAYVDNVKIYTIK